MLMTFKEDLSIDFDALGALTEYYLDKGAKGLFANCLSSEMFDLTREEMIESVSFIVDKVNGRVPVVATGTFEGTIDEQADFVNQMFQTGVESVIAITSLLAEENDSNEVFERNVQELIAKTQGVSLGFYECPVPYKRLMEPVFLGKLVESGRVNYYKDTSLDINHVESKIAYTKDHKANFGLYDAYMVHAVASLQVGSAGLSCIQGNYFPELIAWLCENHDKPNLQDKVKRVQKFFLDNMDVMHYAYPTSAKFFLTCQGVNINTYTRRKDIERFDQTVIDNLKKLEADYKSLGIFD